MAKKASKRRSWTPAHVRTLKSLARKKKHAASIAKALNRTEGAIWQKALTMGLSLDLLSLKFCKEATGLLFVKPRPARILFGERTMVVRPPANGGLQCSHYESLRLTK